MHCVQLLCDCHCVISDVESHVCVCVCVCVSRIGIGITPDGTMTGTSSARGNGIICSPGNSSEGVLVDHYDMTDITFNGLVRVAAPGVSGMSCVQSGGVTTLSWSSSVNNGVSGDAQLVVGGGTLVSWAVGDTNVLDGASNPVSMSSLSVLLVNGSSYSHSVELTKSLVLNWNPPSSGSGVGDGVLQFQAVYSGLAW